MEAKQLQTATEGEVMTIWSKGCAVLTVVLISSLICVSDEIDDANVVKEFERFAEIEFVRLTSIWKQMAEEWVAEPNGQPMPMSFPRKYRFHGAKIEPPPETYAYDVRKTDSLVSPYAAEIEFPFVTIIATTHATGPRESCNGQLLSNCLESGGTLIETNILYRNTAQRMPTTLKYPYVYQKGQWRPKSDFKKTIMALVHLTAAPLLAEDAPELLGATPSQIEEKSSKPKDEAPDCLETG